MTTHAVVYMWLFIHIGAILVASSYFTLGAALAPSFTGRARELFKVRPWRPILIGFAISVPWVLAAVALIRLSPAPAKFSGAVLAGLWVLLGLICGAGLAQHVGRGDRESDVASWLQTFRGGLFICLTWALPIVGWFVMLPLTISAGIGCLVLGRSSNNGGDTDIPEDTPTEME